VALGLERLKLKKPTSMIDARRQNSAAMSLTRVSSASPLDVC
jgi:hypothetical protein